MTITNIHHVQITIPPGAENDARAFYCSLLGLLEIEKPESHKPRGGLWIKVGNRELHIGVEDNINRAVSKAHVAYQVDDVRAWRSKLRQHGIRIIDSIPIPEHERFEFRDPFGNRVEFIQRTG
jgi:catechol 2,3-dioxygenase-like lactoylglutathione lyase family enzyme